MNTIDTLSDKRLVFASSFLGYFITAAAIVIFMNLQLGAFKLAGMLFLPFALSALLVSNWYTRKIMSAKTLKKSVLHSILAATLTSVLTGFLTGLAGAIYEAAKRSDGLNLVSFVGLICIYIGAGLIYALPGILVAGAVLGRLAFQRRNI